MKKSYILARSYLIIILFFFNIFIKVSTTEATKLNDLDKEIINGIIATQNESIAAVKEFKNFQKSRNNSINLINIILENHSSNINKIKYFKVKKENEESLIDYEIPIDDLNTPEKFISFLIDLTESNLAAYGDTIDSIVNEKLQKIIEDIMIKDLKTLRILNDYNNKVK
ncbi:MAG: hypothetical protein CMM49_07810 [Rhodospirillaceae bacterium]|nr:hypothetical protein [Rhodospirillaceae bacterium]|tara:strand:+ start:1339 stop:1845 length:507 start_codon:yes stop_codon:yes gene_type:complete